MTIASSETIPQGWITPQEQLEVLAFSQLEKDLGIAHEPLPYAACSFDKFYKLAIHSILNRSRVTLAGSEAEEFPSLFDRCVERVVPSQLPSSLTNWYTALERIGALPDKIPPLPENIHQILEGACPIYGDSFTVGETHALYLIPPGSLNELEQCVRAYGREFFQSENHPLKFRLFWPTARREHVDIPNNQPQWVLISNDVLQASRRQTYENQVQIVEALSRKSSVDYQVPTLREAIGAVFLHKVATNESLYQEGNEQNDPPYTNARVKETTRNGRLIVGSFNPSGLRVLDGYDYAHEHIGVAVVRKFSNQSGSI